MTDDQKYFNDADYTIFSFMILLPFLIGVYYAFIAKKKSSTVSTYLVGNRNMSIFPVSMSLAATITSATSLIAPVSEIYFYGIQFFLFEFGRIAAMFCAANVYIPVFHNLKITSIYEYLGMRFDSKIRILGTVLFLIKMLMMMSIMINLPAVLFSNVMKIPYEILVSVLCGVCVFYTSFGGIFAVVWTDTFQMIVMLLGMIIFGVVGVYNIGDFKKLWDINEKGGRIFIDWDPNPLVRQSAWSILIGGFFNILAMSTNNQFIVQRFLSLSSLRKINISILIYITSHIILKLSIICIAFAVYATFYGCDPLKSGKISHPDQLVGFFMMHLKSQVPLLPSMFVSAAFCASLSTISSCLNSIAGVILIDLIQPYVKNPIPDARGALIMKIIVIVVGCIFTGLAFTLQHSNGLLQTNMSLLAITTGTSLGVFTLGILFPWANSIGTLVGGISGGVVVGWIVIGSQMAIRKKQIVNLKLPLSIENCDNATITNYYNFLNKTIVNATTTSSPGEPFPLYKISYFYFSIIGALTAVIVGMIISYFTGFNDPNHMDPKLFSPILQKYLKNKRNEVEETKMVDRQI